MNKEIFDKIKSTLETRIQHCQAYLIGIETTDDLKRLTIEQAQLLIRFCKEEESMMTRVVQTDLYHIIGMGDLTPPQMMQFTYLIKDWLQYRSTIKTIAFNFDKISQLPGLPVTAVYRTHGFDGLTLLTGTENLTEFRAGSVPYALNGKIIKVDKERLSEFLLFWSQKAKTNFSENNFLQKLSSGTEYGGVKWARDDDSNYLGIIKQTNSQMLFEGCYRAAQENN